MKKKITKHYELPEIVVRGKKPQRYIIKPEDQLDFIGSLTGGLLSFFSPTQVARKVYDVSKSIKNKEGIDKVGKALFQTNSGIVTKKFEKEHPISAAITNLVGDVAIPAGLLGTAKEINYLARMDMPRFGYVPTTKYQFAPGYAGMGGNPIWKARGKFKDIYEEDLPKLRQMLDSRQFKEFNVPGQGKVRMYMLEDKQPIREDELITLLDKYTPKRTISKEERALIAKAPKYIKFLKSKGLDFSKETRLFQGRSKLGSNAPDAVTQLDVDIYHSHIPEYYQYFKEHNGKDLVYKNKRWLGNINGEMKEVNPEDYIVSQSKAFKQGGWQYDGTNRLRAMTAREYDDIQKTGGLGLTKWTTDNRKQALIFQSEKPREKLIQSIISTFKGKPEIIPTKYAKEAREVYSGAEFSPDVDYKGEVGNYMLFGHDVPIKSIRGNNGDFSTIYKGIYKSLIPITIYNSYE